MLQKIAQFIINIFKFHKKKILFIILSTIFFLFLLFPYEDLSDLVTEKIAQATNNQVFVTFEDLNLSLFPAIGLDMKDVKLELQNLPTIEVKALSISPSLISLLKFKPGFVSKIEGLMDGNIQLAVKSGNKTSEKVLMQNVDLEGENIELSQLKNFVKLPLELKGRADFNLTADIDPQFNEQPDGELSISTKALNLPSTSLPTPFGEIPFDEKNFEKLSVKGRLVGGDLIIEQFELGSLKDPLFVRLKGRIGLQIEQSPTGLVPRPGAFDLKVQIISKSSENKDLRLFINFLDNFKLSANGLDTYTLRVTGRNFQDIPSPSKLNKFD
ncbi:MAG: type II secretion system protein GspN [Bdellovibrionaceae bacterium]|nr:type II secretion system protein GspN [Pseudobdellovibrionaceae bacterium]